MSRISERIARKEESGELPKRPDLKSEAIIVGISLSAMFGLIVLTIALPFASPSSDDEKQTNNCENLVKEDPEAGSVSINLDRPDGKFCP